MHGDSTVSLRRQAEVVRWRRGAPLHVFVAGIVLAAGVVLSAMPTSAYATRAAAAPRITPTTMVSGQRMTVSGLLTPRTRRPVLLQRLTGAVWRTVAHGRTTSNGHYRIVLAAPARAGTYAFRVRAAKGRFTVSRQPKKLPTLTSKPRSITVTAPAAPTPAPPPARDTTPPPVPTELSTYIGDGTVHVAWQPPDYVPDLAGYLVDRATDPNGPWTRVNAQPILGAYFLTVTGLTNDATYWFRVTAIDTSGNQSPPSAVATATPSPMGGTAVPALERAALIDLFNATGGDSWYRNDTGWNTFTDACTWSGVTCTDHHITALDLTSSGLTGALPASIGNLTQLTTLDLARNRLTSVPDALGNLTNLARLQLCWNRLSAVPDTLGNLAALTDLCVGSNQLTRLPDTVGNLTNLTSLSAGSNALTSVPDTLGNLAALTTLNLSWNQLPTLPDTLANLTSLKVLYLQYNDLSSRPTWVDTLPNLTYADLTGNPYNTGP